MSDRRLGVPETVTHAVREAGPRGKKKARARHTSQRARSSYFAGYRLFDFDVIARVNIRGAEGDKHCGRVAAHVDDDAFAEHFAGQIVPVIPSRRAAETIHPVLKLFRLGRQFRQRSLVPEYSKIVAHFYALFRSQVHEHGVALSRGLLIIL